MKTKNLILCLLLSTCALRTEPRDRHVDAEALRQFDELAFFDLEGDISCDNEEFNDFDAYAQEMTRQEIILQEDSLLPDWVKKFGVTLLTKYLALKRYVRKLMNG